MTTRPTSGLLTVRRAVASGRSQAEGFYQTRVSTS